MATYDPLNLDYMDPYAVQILTDSIFERIGNMIVDEISSDEHLNDNNHIPSSLAVYRYLENIASNSSGSVNVIPSTTVGTEIAKINGTPIYNGVQESDGKKLITILTGVPDESNSIITPYGATQYVYFILGDGVSDGLVQSGSCTENETLHFTYMGYSGYKRYVCMFFG